MPSGGTSLNRITMLGRWLALAGSPVKQWFSDNAALYVIIYASLLHYAWAALLAYDPAAGNSTPVHVLVHYCGGRPQAVFVLLLTATMALCAPLVHHPAVRRAMLPVLLIPQQIILFMSAGAGIDAALVGHYADLTPRPWPFILSDQLPVILVSLLYTTALLTIGRGRR